MMQQLAPVLPEYPKQPLIIELVGKPQTQIVRSNKGELVDEADPNSYLGKENRKVEKQTVGKTAKLASQPRRFARDQTLEKNNSKAFPLRQFGVPILTEERMAESKPQIKPNWTDFSKSHRGEVDPDYISGISEANETALNTREFVFFGYFERIRNRLNQAWRPLLRDHIIKFYRQGRTIAGNKDHITRILVTLDNKGEIVHVHVLEKSGTRLLDHAAVKAFNQAGPFPNPPAGLVDANGQIEIRWDFILKS